MGRTTFAASRSSGRGKPFLLCFLLFIYFQSNANPRLGSGLPSRNRTGDQSFAECTNTYLCRFLADLTFLCLCTEHKKRHSYTDWDQQGHQFIRTLEAVWPSSLGRWNWNLKVSAPNLPAYRGNLNVFFFSEVPRSRCVNSQLVNLQPVGIINSLCSICNISLVIYSIPT